MRNIYILLLFTFGLSQDYSLQFDGNGDCIIIPYAEQYNFNNNTNFTIEMWVKSSNVNSSSYKWIWQYGQEIGNDHQIYLRREGTTGIEFWIGDNEPQIYADGFKLGSWIHIAGVFDAETSIMYLFIDGELEGTLENIVLEDYGESRVLIGCDKDNGEFDDSWEFFEGLID